MGTVNLIEVSVIEAAVRGGEPGGGGGTDVTVVVGADGRMSVVLLLDATMTLHLSRSFPLPLTPS